jgi:hypothetical protein
MRDDWQAYYLVVIAVLAAASLAMMLIYRHRNKTSIETDLLLKQMRITSRMRAALDAQGSWLKQLDRFHMSLLEDWETARAQVLGRCEYDIGEMRLPPTPDVDPSVLFRDLET